MIQNLFGSGGIRTHASEETGALNQRLRPLGHATLWEPDQQCGKLRSVVYINCFDTTQSFTKDAL